MSDFVQHNSTICPFTTNSSWAVLSSVEMSIKNKIETVGTPLKDWNIQIHRGILTGFNEAFIISHEKRLEILNNCSTEDERNRTDEVIRPVLRGRNIDRYSYKWAGEYLIATFPSRHYNIDEYPSLKSYLLSFDKRVLAQSGEKDIDGIKGKNARKKTCNKWFETQDSISYWDDFSKPKIIYPETTQGARFAFDDTGIFADKTCFILISEDSKYLQATLSSPLFEFAYRRLFSSIALGEKGYQYNKFSLIKLPIYKDYIKQEVYTNDYFYNLYSLSEEEIQYIINDQ